MNIKMKTGLFKITMVFLLVVFASNFPVNSMTYLNGLEDAFEEPPPDGGSSYNSTASTHSIKDLIIYGASYFLKAGSDIDTLSERIEMTDLNQFDWTGMYNSTNNAVYNLEMMIYYYRQLISKADNTPYNQTVISKLKDLDYQSFRLNYGLNKDVFDQVEQYLSYGDVKGAFKKINININELLNRLYNIRWLIYWECLPTEKEIWDLNNDVSNYYMFGQYMTRVIYEIRKE
jgi:hypothetical protein